MAFRPLGILMTLALASALPATAQLPFYQSPPLEKFTQELRNVGPSGIQVAVPDGTRSHLFGLVKADHYTIRINQFTDVLHPALPPTTLWGYNPERALGVPVGSVVTQRHLGGVIVAQRAKPVQITFRNNLPNLHILPVDTTIMGAEGPQNRVSAHLHGGFVPWLSDGGPFATWDPLGNRGPSFINNAVLNPKAAANEAEFYYPNQQSARLMWYHDHAMGTTRLNAYAGVASAYIIRDRFEQNVLVNLLGLPQFVEKGGRELPLVFQDKIFQDPTNLDPIFPGIRGGGNLWYPYRYDPERWDLADGGTPPDVSCVPEMFGDTILVNGTAYPKATIDPRRYRLRILNACQARFLNLQLYEWNAATGRPDYTKPGPAFFVIGTEGGFLARPVIVPSAPLNFVEPEVVDPANPGGALLTAPAERWDVVVDFNGKAGKKYVLVNDAPAPFPMGEPLNRYPLVDTTGTTVGDTTVLMRFEVKANSSSIPADRPFLMTTNTPLAASALASIDPPLAGKNAATPASMLNWGSLTPSALPIPTRAGLKVRQLTLNESFDEDGRLMQMLGTNIATSPNDFSMMYIDPATETPPVGATEVWQIVNLSCDVHPIHIHLVNAQLLSRQPIDMAAYTDVAAGEKGKLVPTGPARGPLATELGWKETFKANPGEVTTVIMKFDLPWVPFRVPVSPRTGGYEYVWHCHILEHEEHDMMRPLIVQPLRAGLLNSVETIPDSALIE